MLPFFFLSLYLVLQGTSEPLTLVCRLFEVCSTAYLHSSCHDSAFSRCHSSWHASAYPRCHSAWSQESDSRFPSVQHRVDRTMAEPRKEHNRLHIQNGD